MSKVYVAQTPYLVSYGGEETVHLRLLGVFDSMEKAVKAISDRASELVNDDYDKEVERWEIEGFFSKKDFTNLSQIVEMDMNISLAIFD